MRYLPNGENRENRVWAEAFRGLVDGSGLGEWGEALGSYAVLLAMYAEIDKVLSEFAIDPPTIYWDNTQNTTTA